MKVQYDPEFVEKLKKQNVRVSNSFRKAIKIFSKNPADPRLHVHELKREYKGLKSIDVTVNWRAIYEEITEGNDLIIYFVTLGTHRQLYK
ncbi:MAG: hypothetical protein HW400_632 [Candidatus Levybacteria bacterium]|nr:hypothetical protein [Candidatus Levybacteria bacterium]